MVPADSRRIARVPRYSGSRYASDRFAHRPVTVCGAPFQGLALTIHLATTRPYNPAEAGTSAVWALPRSLATTGGIIRLFSLPAGTKMFQFPALASPKSGDGSPSGCRVVPFGDPRISGHLRLPADYRSLSSPSSPVRAKASAMRPSLLSLFIRPHLRASGMIYTFSSLLLKLLFACTICHRSFIFVSYVSDGVENNGFEPLTLCVQGRCSSQLS